MNKCFILIISCLIIFSCKSNDGISRNFPGKIASVTEKNIINRIDYEPTQIKIDLRDTIEGNLDDYFRLKKVIYLDGKSPIGQISVIRQHKEKLFILDTKNTKQLYCFNLEGKLLWEFKSLGKGPMEYTKINDFIINEKNKTIDILDSGSHKIITVDINTGVAKNEFILGCFGREMVLYSNGDYLLYTMNITLNDDLNYKLLLVNTNQEVKSRNLPVWEEEKDKYAKGLRSLDKSNETIYFTETLNDTIYTIKNDKLKTGYYVDFLDKKYPENLKENYTNNKATYLKEEKPYIESIDRVSEKNGILNFMFAYKREFYTTFYDINKKTTYLFKNLKKGKTLGESDQILFKGNINDGYVNIIEPYIFDMLRTKIGSNKNLRDKLIHDKPEMYDVITKTNENSNPVIFVYEFKKNN